MMTKFTDPSIRLTSATPDHLVPIQAPGGSPGGASPAVLLAAAGGAKQSDLSAEVQARTSGDATNAGAISAHSARSDNPHGTTAAQVGAYTQSQTDALMAAAVANLMNGAPGALDTLKELADAMGDDQNFAATVTNALASKLGKSANLSDLTDAAAARTALGLGDAATKNTGTTAGTLVAGDDARFTDQLPASRINISTWQNSIPQSLQGLAKCQPVNLREFIPYGIGGGSEYDWALAINAYCVAAKARQQELYGNNSEGQLAAYSTDNMFLHSQVKWCRAAKLVGVNGNTTMLNAYVQDGWNANQNIHGSDGTELDQIDLRDLLINCLGGRTTDPAMFANGGWNLTDCAVGGTNFPLFNQSIDLTLTRVSLNAGDAFSDPPDGMAMVTMTGNGRLFATDLSILGTSSGAITTRNVVGIRATACRLIRANQIFARRVKTILEVSPGAGENTRDVVIESIKADTGAPGGDQILINPTAGGTVGNVQIGRMRLDTGNTGLAVKGTSGAITKVQIGDTLITGMTSHGVSINNSNVSISQLTTLTNGGDGVRLGDTQDVSAVELPNVFAKGNTGWGINNNRAGNSYTRIAGISLSNTAGDLRDAQTAATKTVQVQGTSANTMSMPSLAVPTFTGNPTFSGGLRADSALTVGTGDNTSTVGQGFVRAPTASSATSNIAGAALRLQGGQGRGTGKAGSISLESGSSAGVSGTGLSGLNWSFTLDATNGRLISAGIPMVIDIAVDPVFLGGTKLVSFKYVSDTSIQIQMRGTDGTVRSATLTLS